MAGPSLVTDPARFRRQLAAWDNPSFLGTPGHLVSADAPSGTVSGVASVGRGGAFDPPAGPESRHAATLSPAPTVPTAQRAAVDAEAPRTPPRRAPHVGPAPGPSVDLLTAASADVPPPVARPAVGPPPAALPPPDDAPDEPEPVPGAVATPSRELQRHETDAGSSAVEGEWDVQRSVAVPPAGRQLPRPGEGPAEVGSAAGLAPELPMSAAGPETVLAQRATLGEPPRESAVAAANPGPSSRGEGSGPPAGAHAPAVQRVAVDAGVPAVTGRRRLGLGDPLRSVPSPAPVGQRSADAGLREPTALPSASGAPLGAVQRLPGDGGPGTRPPIAPGTVPAVPPLGIAAPGLPAGSAASAAAAASALPGRAPHPATGSAPHPATGSAPPLQRAVLDAVAADPADGSPPSADGPVGPARAAATGPEPHRPAAEVPTAGTAAPGEPVQGSPWSSEPWSDPSPLPVMPVAAEPPAVSRGPVIQRSLAIQHGPGIQPGPPAGHGPAVQRSLAPPAPAPALSRPSMLVPDALPASVPATTEPAMAPGEPGGAADPSPAAADLARPEWADAAPADPVRRDPVSWDGSTGLGPDTGQAPLVGGAEPLRDAGTHEAASLPGLLGAAPNGPVTGLPLQRAGQGMDAPLAASSHVPSRTAVPAVVQRTPADVDGAAALAVARSAGSATDAAPIGGGSTDRGSGGSAVRDGGGDPRLPAPEPGRSVGPVGSRPLQRSLIERPAPALPAPRPTWSPADVADGGAVPRSDAGVAGTGSGRAGTGQVPAPAFRIAALPGASPVPDGAARSAAPTLQALLAADDVPRPAAPRAPAEPVVERAVAPEEPAGALAVGGVAAPTLSRAASEPTAAAAAAAGGPAPATATAPADVDALVRRLYDPLARRLRAELRLDRERIGRSLDLRH